MNVVELYGRVRHAVRIESLSNPEAAQRFGVDPRTVAKMLAFSAAPGYLSTPEQRHACAATRSAGDRRRRYGRGATLITSQIPVERWHDLIGDPTLADAIPDRIVHNAHRIQLRGESLRKKKAQEQG
jgi:hypothetical protein